MHTREITRPLAFAFLGWGQGFENSGLQYLQDIGIPGWKATGAAGNANVDRMGSNPVNPRQAAWKADTDILLLEHQQLRVAIAQLSLAERTALETVPQTARLIRGIAAHDLYHAGQIRLLRRLCGGGGRAPN
jgi:hypothetical protein